MKYVNVSVQCFDRNALKFLGLSGLPPLLDVVKCSEKDGKYYIGKFDIATFVNIRGTTAKNNPQNPVDNKKILDFRIRLTYLDEDPQFSYNLGDFTMDLSSEEIIHHADFDYAEQVQVINVDNFEIQKPGHYIIKVLVKERGAELYEVQLAHSLHIEE